MNVSERIDNFIEFNTTRESGSWEWRTRDALNIALARLDRAEASVTELTAEVAKLRERVTQLESETAYFQSTDYAADRALSEFEHTAPIDWREYETPLGQMLDGQGDEIEP